MSEHILKLENITKIYDNGILANKNVNLDINQGEIHAIVGENGAGKSTLMKVIFGLEQPSSGDIYVHGKKTVIHSVNQAISLGIGMVHQHFMLIPSFTVTQNVMLGMEPKKGLAIDYGKADKQVQEFSQKYGFKVNPTDILGDITVGQKQKVEIIKALIRGAKLLILDEPTAVLTPQETEALFVQLKLLKEDGHTIIFISHKLKEVMEICDRVTVMRKGETKGVFSTQEVTIKELSNRMVGRDVVLSYDKTPQQLRDNILSVRHVSMARADGTQGLKDLSFSVQGGMIFGIAGVEGNGQHELIHALTSGQGNYEGEIRFNGKELKGRSVHELRADGFSYIPEDRMHTGIADQATITDNIISNRFDDKDLFRGMLYDKKKIQSLTAQLIEQYQIVCGSGQQSIGHLSGGNIQKVVVARECAVSPKLLIAEQPTRGVDLGAAEIIHKKLLELRDGGAAVLMVSADISEVLEVSDVLIVLYSGEIVAYIEDPSKLSERDLGDYMLGVNKQSQEEIGGAYRG